MYEKIKNILSKKIEEDITKYKEMRYIKDLLKSISFEERITRVLGLSTVFYLGLFAVLVVLMELSPLIFPFLMVSSVTGSVLLDRFMLKRFNNKKRVQEFSKARKNVEIEEEIIKHEFEMEKVVSKIKVNEEALSIILDKSEMYDKLSGDYELLRKNDDSFSKKEISRLNEKTNENYNRLNKFSRIKVIEEKFYRLSNRVARYNDTFKNSMLFGIMFMLVVAMPFMTKAINPNIGLTVILSSPFVGGMIPGIYLRNRDKLQKKILNKLNINLEEMDDYSEESLVKLVKEMGLDISKLLEYTQIVNEESVSLEEKLGSTEVVRQEVYVSEETIIKEDVNRLGLKKRYPN